ncbi:SRPBCC family protein [Joostella sp. CR20]|uniref:SRPBCC family protein n=1 Tax=Joostella sp. CR20 TaxID=2804312 RepID=UPI00313AED8D
MRILKYLIFLFLIVAIGLSIYVAIQPDDYQIVTTRVVNAPKPVIYNYVSDFKKWNKWSVWFDQDPNMHIEYGAVTEGENASFKWNSDILGKGNIVTTYATLDSVSHNLEFIKPKESKAHRFWSLDDTANKDGILVTSGIEGKLSFTDKFVLLFQNSMQHNFETDFKSGLIKLDSVVTTDMKKYKITTQGTIEYGGGYYLYQTTSTKQNEVHLATQKMFPEIEAFMEQNYMHSSGDAFTIFQEEDHDNNTVIFSVCVPIKEKVITPPGSTILCGFIETGSYFKTILKGDYSNLNEAWSKARETIKTNNTIVVDSTKNPFEAYVITPQKTFNPAELLTEIYIPVKPQYVKPVSTAAPIYSSSVYKEPTTTTEEIQ